MSADAAKTACGDGLLRVDDLTARFPLTHGVTLRRQIGVAKAVDGVSFAVQRGETLGLVGESGCGKREAGLAVLRMHPATAGRIVYEGEDITRQTRGPFRRRMQRVYQDPYGSVDPRMKVADIVGEPLVVHQATHRRAEYRERVVGLLATVGLRPAMAEREPPGFSGGQRQRIGIARALALEPSLVIRGEPVSALDMSIQAQVINVLMELQERLALSCLFVAHDLAVLRHVSHRIAVMDLGRIVEIADRGDLFREPLHPHAQALPSAVPVADPEVEAAHPRTMLRGEVPGVLRPPPGCRFHPRCPQAMAVCRTEAPPLACFGSRQVACHLHGARVIPIVPATAAVP